MYVNPDDNAEVKNTIIKVASSQFNASVYKNKFPDLFKKYSWDNMAEGIMNLIENCLNSQSKKQSTLN